MGAYAMLNSVPHSLEVYAFLASTCFLGLGEAHWSLHVHYGVFDPIVPGLLTLFGTPISRT